MDYSFRFIDDSVKIESLRVYDDYSFIFTFREHTYVVVYGNCSAGGFCSGGFFIAIPNWNVAVTVWEPNHVSFNTEQILDALDTDYEDAVAIAEAVFKHALDSGYYENVKEVHVV